MEFRALGKLDVFGGLSEWPLVTREECWRAYRPAQPFSESAFQRLRRIAVVSPGVRVHPRHHGHLLGQERCFSRLNLLALNACRPGDVDEARRLSTVAADLESRAEVQELVNLLGAPLASGVSRQHTPFSGPEQELVRKVCALTDARSAKARHIPARVPARVERVAGGMAYLYLQAGQYAFFSLVKLSRIGRDEPGAMLVLYIIDLGGTDELVRARPAVLVDDSEPIDPPGRPAPGAFERVVTDVQGRDAELPDQLLDQDASGPPVDLTGLRFVS